MRINRVLYLAISLSLVLLAIPLLASQSNASPPAPAGAVLNVDPDPYEPDDSCGQGGGGGWSDPPHTFHTPTDVDWGGVWTLPGFPGALEIYCITDGQSVLIEAYRTDCRTRLGSGVGSLLLNFPGETEVALKFSAVGGWMGEYRIMWNLLRYACIEGNVYRTGTQIGLPGAHIEYWIHTFEWSQGRYVDVRDYSTVTGSDGAFGYCRWYCVICPDTGDHYQEDFSIFETDPPGCTSTGAEIEGSQAEVVDPNQVKFVCGYGEPCAAHILFYDTPPLALGGASPQSGQSCPGQVQTFVTSVTDVATATRISQVEYVFDAGAWLEDAVYLSYDRTTNTISLRNDDNTGWLGGVAPGSAQVLENSRVRVPLTQCHVNTSPDGKTLLVTWALACKSDFAGTYNQYLYARHQSGYYQGFEDVGDWTVSYCGTPTPTLTPTVTPTPPPGGSGEASFQQGVNGYGGCQDTSLDPWEANRNHAGDGSLIVRANNSFSSLLRYELTSLPVYAVINQATLSLYADSWQTTSELKATLTVGAYEVLREWAAGQATWMNAMTGAPWGTGGCSNTASDRAAVAADEALVNALGQWYDLDLTALAQKWVQNPAMNHGLVLKSFSSPAGVLFRSADHGGMAQRPKLVIEYTIPSPATTTITATPTRTATATMTATRTPTQGAYPPPRTITPTHWVYLPLLLKGR